MDADVYLLYFFWPDPRESRILSLWVSLQIPDKYIVSTILSCTQECVVMRWVTRRQPFTKHAVDTQTQLQRFSLTQDITFCTRDAWVCIYMRAYTTRGEILSRASHLSFLQIFKAHRMKLTSRPSKAVFMSYALLHRYLSQFRKRSYVIVSFRMSFTDVYVSLPSGLHRNLYIYTWFLWRTG